MNEPTCSKTFFAQNIFCGKVSCRETDFGAENLLGARKPVLRPEPIEPFGGTPRITKPKSILPKRRYGVVPFTLRSPLCPELLPKDSAVMSDDRQPSTSTYANTSTDTQQMNTTRKRVSFANENSDSDTSSKFGYCLPGFLIRQNKIGL